MQKYDKYPCNYQRYAASNILAMGNLKDFLIMTLQAPVL
jgi:hypothetical protein